MKDPSHEEVATAVTDVFNKIQLEGHQGIDPSFRLPFLAGAVSLALGISVPAAYMLLASMS